MTDTSMVREDTPGVVDADPWASLWRKSGGKHQDLKKQKKAFGSALEFFGYELSDFQAISKIHGATEKEELSNNADILDKAGWKLQHLSHAATGMLKTGVWG
jgi:hypothetical protein